MELALPILEKVFNKTLRLYDYKLSNAQSEALVMASRFFDNFVKSILLDNCGIEDKKFAKIINSLNELSDFKSIIYRNNQFEMESARAVMNLLYKKMPFHLDELVIVNCRISYETSEYLIDRLIDRSYLRHLALVNANLSERSMSGLCEFLNKNRFIQEIDLSWNRLEPNTWMQFLRLLKDNRRLRSVNLSWN